MMSFFDSMDQDLKFILVFMALAIIPAAIAITLISVLGGDSETASTCLTIYLGGQ